MNKPNFMNDIQFVRDVNGISGEFVIIRERYSKAAMCMVKDRIVVGEVMASKKVNGQVSALLSIRGYCFKRRMESVDAAIKEGKKLLNIEP